MRFLWERYFLKECFKVFLLFIGCFYFLYVLIDLSAHTKTFQQESLRWIDILFYYLFQFTHKADILIPFALLVSFIKVLTTSNARHEIVALVVGGIPLKKLLRPFFLAASVCTFFLYLNFEYIQPRSLIKLENFEEKFFEDSSKEDPSKQHPVNQLFLNDGSLMIYRLFHPSDHSFEDAYWIRSFDDIYRIKYLFPYAKKPMGKLVDHLQRSPEGDMLKSESFLSLPFPQMEFEDQSLYAAAHPPRLQSISQLIRHIPWKQVGFGLKKMNDRDAQAITSCFYKLLSPLICFFALLAPAPFAIRFGRSHPIFFIYALSLFGLIGFFTLVNASVILGESQVISPFWALCLPYLAVSLGIGWRYAKL